jgi:hypothetical protein
VSANRVIPPRTPCTRRSHARAVQARASAPGEASYSPGGSRSRRAPLPIGSREQRPNSGGPYRAGGPPSSPLNFGYGSCRCTAHRCRDDRMRLCDGQSKGHGGRSGRRYAGNDHDCPREPGVGLFLGPRSRTARTRKPQAPSLSRRVRRDAKLKSAL